MKDWTKKIVRRIQNYKYQIIIRRYLGVWLLLQNDNKSSWFNWKSGKEVLQTLSDIKSSEDHSNRYGLQLEKAVRLPSCLLFLLDYFGGAEYLSNCSSFDFEWFVIFTRNIVLLHCLDNTIFCDFLNSQS